MKEKKFGRLIFISSTLSEATAQAPEDFKESIRMSTPTKKIAVPEDVANTVSFLASEKSGHITGTYIPVCGGA